MRLPPSVMTVISLVPPRIDAAADDVAGDAHRVLQRLARSRSASESARRGSNSTTCTSQSRLPVSATRLGQRAHPLDRGIDLGRVADQERQAPAGRRNVADVDARIAAKLGRDRIFLRLQPLLQRVAAASASSSKWLPPARSRPRLILYCGSHFGQLPHRACPRSGWGSRTARRARRRARPARPSSAGNSSISRSPAWRCSGQHLASVDLTTRTLTPVRDLDLDLVVADLGHPAADAAAGDDLVALLDRRDRRLMLLHPPLLRADHQHVEDDEDQQPAGDARSDAGGAARLPGRRGLHHASSGLVGLDIREGCRLSVEE